MRTKPITRIAVASAAAMFASAAMAQAPTFADPVRLKAGDQLLGEGRLYPSPVFHDLNGDGRLDIVVGDLRGLLTVALRQPGDGPITYAAEQNVKALDGKDIDFHNW